MILNIINLSDLECICPCFCYSKCQMLSPQICGSPPSSEAEKWIGPFNNLACFLKIYQNKYVSDCIRHTDARFGCSLIYVSTPYILLWGRMHCLQSQRYYHHYSKSCCRTIFQWQNQITRTYRRESETLNYVIFSSFMCACTPCNMAQLHSMRTQMILYYTILPIGSQSKWCCATPYGTEYRSK